jgi:hypothetical protein
MIIIVKYEIEIDKESHKNAQNVKNEKVSGSFIIEHVHGRPRQVQTIVHGP